MSSVEPFIAPPPLENVGEEFRECDFSAEIKGLNINCSEPSGAAPRDRPLRFKGPGGALLNAPCQQQVRHMERFHVKPGPTPPPPTTRASGHVRSSSWRDGGTHLPPPSARQVWIRGRLRECVCVGGRGGLVEEGGEEEQRSITRAAVFLFPMRTRGLRKQLPGPRPEEAAARRGATYGPLFQTAFRFSYRTEPQRRANGRTLPTDASSISPGWRQEGSTKLTERGG